MSFMSKRNRVRLVWLLAALPALLVLGCGGGGNSQLIVFVSLRNGNYQIYIMNANGSGQTRLTNNAANDTTPSLSRDGTKIVFNSNRDGNDEIYTMNVDGSNQTRLTNSAGFDITHRGVATKRKSRLARVEMETKKSMR